MGLSAWALGSRAGHPQGRVSWAVWLSLHYAVLRKTRKASAPMWARVRGRGAQRLGNATHTLRCRIMSLQACAPDAVPRHSRPRARVQPACRDRFDKRAVNFVNFVTGTGARKRAISRSCAFGTALALVPIAAGRVATSYNDRTGGKLAQSSASHVAGQGYRQ